MWRVAVLHHGSDGDVLVSGLLASLRGRGVIDGVNCVYDMAGAQGRLDRLPALAADLVQLQPHVLVALGGVAALAAQRSTRAIPIVHAIVLDPLEIGLDATNVTGVTTFDSCHAWRQLAVLRELLPSLRSLVCLTDEDAPLALDAVNPLVNQAIDAARKHGLALQVVAVRGDSDEIEASLDAVASAGALLALEVPAVLARLPAIARIAERRRWPALMPGARMAVACLEVGTALPDALDTLADYVLAVLHGSRPAQLPTKTVRCERLVIDLGMASRIGVVVPESLSRRATQLVLAKDA